MYRCPGRHYSHQRLREARAATGIPEGFLVVVHFFKQLILSLAVSEHWKHPCEVTGNVRCGSLRVRTASFFLSCASCRQQCAVHVSHCLRLSILVCAVHAQTCTSLGEYTMTHTDFQPTQNYGQIRMSAADGLTFTIVPGADACCNTRGCCYM